jgi:hypothetical protein
MASNKNLGTSLVAMVIFGLVVSIFEPNTLSTHVADSSPIVTVSNQSTETQPETLRQELTSYIEFTQHDQVMFQPMLVLLFMVIKIAGVISFCILVLMLVTSKSWRRVCHSKGLVVASSEGKDAAKPVPFDNKHFPESMKKTMSHSDMV